MFEWVRVKFARFPRLLYSSMGQAILTKKNTIINTEYLTLKEQLKHTKATTKEHEEA